MFCMNRSKIGEVRNLGMVELFALSEVPNVAVNLDLNGFNEGEKYTTWDSGEKSSKY